MLCIICVASKFYKNRISRQLTMTPNSSESSTKKVTMNNNENLEGYPQETPKTTLFDKGAQEITQFIEEIEQKRYPYYTETPPIHDRNQTSKTQKQDQKASIQHTD